MLTKLFNKIATAVAEDVKAIRSNRVKTMNELIDEIHDTFYTEVDRLLAEAKIMKPLDTQMQDLIDKRERLIKLGFKNTQECKEAELEIERLEQLKAENMAKYELQDAIGQFSFRYPMYKFITEDSVKKICAKYNLIYGSVDLYTGTVPDSNLKHMEDFHIFEEDMLYLKFERSIWSRRETVEFVSYQECELNLGMFRTKKPRAMTENDLLEYQFDDSMMKMYRNRHHDSSVQYRKAPLEIAAPAKDFDLSKMEVKDFKISKIEIPDPVVLQPVYCQGKKYYLIVTAWGQEASDELVINPNHN